MRRPYMPRMDPRCPCTRECPDRGAECVRDCERHKAYEAEKKAEYEERERRGMSNSVRFAPTEGMKRTLRTVQRERKRGRRK